MLHQIGAGALGPVFRAQDATSDRLVAIKVFRLDLPPERIHQFVAELERLIAADLTLPAIAAPISAGIEGTAAYLAQEYVAADSLDIVIRDHGPAPSAEALRIATQVAGALDVAAGAGVNHGALHPRDVLISQDEARLTGLGITQALERIGAASPLRRPYTAPERMAAGAWDRRADVFGLAALMHEVLWGRRVAGSGGQVAGWLTDITGGDLALLRQVFARALADDPGERFDTASEFVATLKDAFPGLGVEAAPAERRQRRSRAKVEQEPRLPLAIEPASETSPADMPLQRASMVEEVPLAAEPEPRPEQPAPAILDEPFSHAGAAEEPPVAFEPLLRGASPHSYEKVPAPLAAGPQLGSGDEPISALDRSRSALWPLVVALIVGLGLGFAGGYTFGLRDRTVGLPASSGAPAAGPVDSARVASEPAAGPANASAAIAPAAQPQAAPTPPVPRAAAPSAGAAERRAVGPEPGRLTVRSTPSGAQVIIDGRDHGRTPATISELARGPHRVRIVRDGYAVQERRVVISARRPAQSVSVTLARARGALPKAEAVSASLATELSVESKPSGARVYVDGKLMGTTPVVLPAVTAGSHAVRLDYNGYRRWTSSVRVVAGERNKVTASLEK